MSAKTLLAADFMADRVERALSGMDAAGGDRDGMPECPWCHSDGTYHDADCELIAAREAVAEYHAARRTDGRKR